MLPRKSIALAVFFLAGCATGPKAKGPNETEILNRKLGLLVEQIEQQNVTIAKLQSRVEFLSTENKKEPERVVERVRPKPKRVATRPFSIPVEKLRPPKPDIDSEDSEWAPDTGTTVADSTHESMYIYFQGLDEQRAQNYEKALKSFRDFLATSPQHVYADRAQFQIVNTHYLNKEFSLAVVASNDLETKYSYSLKLPEALYLRAMSYSKLGQEEQMRSTLARLYKFFPEDPAAIAAQKMAAFRASVPLMPKGRR